MQPLSVHAQPASDPAAAKHPAPAAPPIAGRSIQLREGKLPLVPLTGDIFYRVVASEIAAQTWPANGASAASARPARGEWTSTASKAGGAGDAVSTAS